MEKAKEKSKKKDKEKDSLAKGKDSLAKGKDSQTRAGEGCGLSARSSEMATDPGRQGGQAAREHAPVAKEKQRETSKERKARRNKERGETENERKVRKAREKAATEGGGSRTDLDSRPSKRPARQQLQPMGQHDDEDSDADFVTETRRRARSPPKFPLPPQPLSVIKSKGALTAYLREVLNHVHRGVRGAGSLPMWDKRVPKNVLSEVSFMVAGQLVEGDTIALSDWRSWNPGMALGRNFTTGPGRDGWKDGMYLPWLKYVRLVAEVICSLHGVDPETADGSDKRFVNAKVESDP
jgi:hypothetical protein